MPISSLLLSTAVALRLLNPHSAPVDADLVCDGRAQQVRLDANGVADLPEGCTFAGALVPLTVLETSVEDAGEWQRDASSEAECGTAAMAVPLYACASGVATASVGLSQGASYRWSAQGATILDGMGTNLVAVQLTDPKTASLTCVITNGDCTRTATGAISIREPLVVRELHVPTGINVNVPVTLTWSYEAAAPDTQMLLGDAFAEAVSLPGSARSYTFTPRETGTRTVELLAGYGPHLVTGPKKRRRAVGGSVFATQCPSVRTSANMDVRGCGGERAVLTVPRDVGAGETFKALVNADTGQKVEWSVENGSFDSISSSGDRAQVRAGTNGKLKLIVRVERSPGCFAIADTELPIILQPGQCAIVPTALLAVTKRDCDSATVSATFTGTPPFAGTWSDGTELRNTSKFTQHEFKNPGTYGITRFHDASCFGTLGGTVEVETLRTSVNLQNAGGSCGNYALRATFGGVPPFTGQWSDGEAFTTSNSVLERTVPGGGRDWWVNAHDASCAQLTTSRAIKLPAPPSVSVHGSGLCQILPNEGLTVGTVFTGGAPPYRLEWSNGLVTTGNDPHLWQKFPATASSVEYQLVRATANGCEVAIERGTVSITHRHGAVIAPQNRFNVLCAGRPYPQKLSVAPSPGGILKWSASGVGAIYRGQGEQEIEFIANTPGWTTLSVATTFPDNVCTFETTAIDDWYFSPPVWIGNLHFVPSTIKAGGTAQLRYESNNVASSYGLYLPPDRKSDWNQTYFTVTDTHGPGTFFIRMVWTDPCSGDHEETATLTITN